MRTDVEIATLPIGFGGEIRHQLGIPVERHIIDYKHAPGMDGCVRLIRRRRREYKLRTPWRWRGTPKAGTIPRYPHPQAGALKVVLAFWMRQWRKMRGFYPNRRGALRKIMIHETQPAVRGNAHCQTCAGSVTGSLLGSSSTCYDTSKCDGHRLVTHF
jgi:hypothetical protein